MQHDVNRISRIVPPAVISKLRAAREAHGRSLTDISSTTRINRKFLEDIDKGILPELPITYLRALFRTYAQEIGLDGNALLSELEVTQEPPEIEQPHSDQSPVPGTPVQPQVPDNPPESARRKQRNVLMVLVVVLIAGMIGVVLWIRQDRSAPPAQEISFPDVVKEQESRIAKSAGRFDSASPLKNSSVASVIRDSLTLEAVASDSVVFKCTIDGIRTVEHTFSPLYRMQWKASRSFLVSVSNASALSFTLNGKKIGTLSSAKKSLKNITLSWETMRKSR